MLGTGEAAMKIEKRHLVRFARVDQYFGEAAGNENEWGWVPVPSVTGDAIFDLGVGNTFSINGNSEDVQKRRRSSSITFSCPETQARLLVECGMVPAAVDLDRSGTSPE